MSGDVRDSDVPNSVVHDVVIADDWSDIRLLARALLNRSGRFRVVAEATTGVEAAEAVRVHQPDVLLLDLAMPVLDGVETLPLIRATSPDTKVVVFTGLSGEELIEAARCAGADRLIDKNDLVRQLVPVVLDALGAPAIDLTERRPHDARDAEEDSTATPC